MKHEVLITDAALPVSISKMFFTAALPKAQGGAEFLIAPLAARDLKGDFKKSQYTEVVLTPLQLSILEFLLQEPWRLRAYDEIIENTDLHSGTTLKQLFDHLSRIQNRLTTAGAPKDNLINLKGWGYVVQTSHRTEPDPDEALDIDGYAYLDLRNGQIVSGETHVQLSKDQFNVVRALFERSGKILTHQEIVKHAGLPEKTTDQQVRDFFKRLSPKLKQAGVGTKAIQNVRGIGYCAFDPNQHTANTSQKLSFNFDTYLDLRTAQVVCGDHSVRLSKSLFNIARVLLQRPWTITTCQDLIKQANLRPESTDQDVANLISDLKDCLGEVGLERSVIATVVGGAYYVRTRRKAHALPEDRLKIDNTAYLDTRSGLIIGQTSSRQLSLRYTEFLKLLLEYEGQVQSREVLIDILGLTEDKFEEMLARRIEALDGFLREINVSADQISQILSFAHGSSKIKGLVSDNPEGGYICAFRKQAINCTQDIEFTDREIALLQIFAEHPYQIFSKAEILDLLDVSEDVFESASGSIIKRLRKKLNAAGFDGDMIVTAYGYGWYLQTPVRPLPKVTQMHAIHDDAYLDLRCAQIVREDKYWQLGKRDVQVLSKLLGRPFQIFTRESFYSDEISIGDTITQEEYRDSVKRVRAIFKAAEIPKELIKNDYGIGYHAEAAP